MSEHLPLGQLGSFSRGRGGTKADEVGIGVPCIRYGELYTRHDCVVREFVSFIHNKATLKYTALRKGDVVFAASGETHEEIGKAAVFIGDESAYAGGDTLIFRPNEEVDPLFLGYAGNSASAARFKAKYGQGSSVIHIAGSHLEHLPLFVPALAEQRRIAEILDTLDEAIRTTEALIAKLEQVKKGLLHDLLTRGIDDNGELRDPERHPEQFKDSPLGRIPRAWDVDGIEAYGASDRPFIKTGPFGSSLKGEHWVDRGVPVITIGALGEGQFEKEEMLFVAPSTARTLRSYAVRPGDVVFSRVADVGRSVVVREDQKGWLLSSNLMWIAVDPTRADPDFLWLNLSGNPAIRAQVRRSVNAGGREVANGTVLRGLKFPWPALSEQHRIVEIAGARHRRWMAEIDEAKKLHRLRAGLMDDLLSGRVRVSVESPEVSA